jgi:hypothetical protein
MGDALTDVASIATAGTSTGTGASTMSAPDMMSELQRQLNRFSSSSTPAAWHFWTDDLAVTGAPDGGVTAARASKVVAQRWSEATGDLTAQLQATAALNYGGTTPDAWLAANLSTILATVQGYADARGLPSAASGLFSPTNIAIFVGGGLLYYLLTRSR